MSEVPASAEVNEQEPQEVIMSRDRDETWLLQVGVPTEQLTDTWFGRMNRLVAWDAARKDLENAAPFDRTMGRGAYLLFILELGWLDETSPFYDKVQKYYNNPAQRGHHIRPNQVVRSLRAMTDNGMDGSKMIREDLNFLKYYPETINERYNRLEAAGLDARLMLAHWPRLLSRNPQSFMGKIEYMRRVSGMFQWAFDIDDLIEQHPNILSSKFTKFGLLARLAADHVQYPSLVTPNDVLSAFIRPAESYVAAAALEDDFIPASAKKYQTRIPAAHRRDHVLELLDDRGVRTKLGIPTIRAYLRYAPLSEQEAEHHPNVLRHESELETIPIDDFRKFVAKAL